MSLAFGEYEEWMRDQIVDLFCEQYGNEKGQFTEYFDRFYSGFQKDRAIRIVMLDGKKVAGFVSFVHWPYVHRGIELRSYQACNVIIHKDHRGQGLYNKMLDHFTAKYANSGIDFVVGFPIKEILKLYLRSGWTNPFNLQWYVKPVNPAGKIFGITTNKLERAFSSTKKYTTPGLAENAFELNSSSEFYSWNESYNNLVHHYFHLYEKDGHWVEFSLKLNKRKYLNELVIGEVNFNNADPKFLSEAFRSLSKKAFSLVGISILSFCCNSYHHGAISQLLPAIGYRKINKEIKFILHNFKADEKLLNDPENWKLFRRDIDTW